MRVLVACEFSGTVREAFLRRGHDAYSCDLLPSLGITPKNPKRHIRGDVTQVLKQRWDLVIAHPPCTYLANSGVQWLFKDGERNEERWESLRRGAEFFVTCFNANADKVAVENPIQHKYAKELIGRPHTQIIHPWQFGHGETKVTCLWLKNLPPLVPTKIVDERKQTGYFMSPGPW